MEQSVDKYLVRKYRDRNLWVFAVALVGFPLFGILDYVYYPEFFNKLMIIRGIVVLSCVLMIIFLKKIPLKYLNDYFQIIILIGGFAISSMSYVTRDGFQSKYFAGLFLVFITASILADTTVWVFLSTSLMILVYHVGINYMAGNFSFNDFFSQAFFLGYGVTIGCVLNVLTTRVVKREHEAVKRTEFLIKTLSHDVKNRLSIIKGCLSLICADYEDKKPEQKMKVGILDMESTKVSQIVNNLINCFSEEYINLNKKPESIHKIKEMIMSDWEQKFKLNSINFDFKLINISEQDSIDIDLNYIELAWNNILANSIQYNKPGSRVCLNIARQNGSVLFKFLSDNEIIPEEKREEIFNKYTDSKQHTFCSKGLGLYYVRFVSRLHGGNAWYGVEDESGKGMFILEFPFDAGE